MISDELNTINDCFFIVIDNYKNIKKLGKNKRIKKSYFSNLEKTLINYVEECKNFPYSIKLKNYEKAACRAVAIRNNPIFDVSNSFDTINNDFAVDVALKFCEREINTWQDKNFDDIFNEYSELSYSKELLSNILSYDNVNPCDISENFKIQVNLLTKIIKFKKIEKSLKR